jgi:two-component system KDP operon response regulator KdpE
MLPTMTWLLVAEDDADLREALAEALRGHGYEVRTAADGADVIRMLDEEAEMPAVLLLDLMMPRVDGRDVLQAVRGLGRARLVPVVVVTGDEMSDADVAAFGVTEVLQKPVAIERLFAAVDTACRAR